MALLQPANGQMITVRRSDIAITAAVVVCSTVLLFAAFSKLMHWSEFMRGFPGLPFLAREPRVALAIFVVSLEIAVAFHALARPTAKYVLTSLSVLFGAFLLYATMRFIPGFDEWLGATKGCGCFMLSNVAVDQLPKVATLARNGCLFAAVFIPAMYQYRKGE